MKTLLTVVIIALVAMMAANCNRLSDARDAVVVRIHGTATPIPTPTMTATPTATPFYGSGKVLGTLVEFQGGYLLINDDEITIVHMRMVPKKEQSHIEREVYDAAISFLDNMQVLIPEDVSLPTDQR